MAGLTPLAGLARLRYRPNGVVFDGANGYLSRTSNFSGEGDTTQWTVAFAVKLASLSGNQVFLKAGNGTSTRYLIFKHSSDVVRVFAHDGTAIIAQLDSSITLTTGQRYTILVSFDMTDTAKRHMYIDDVDRLGPVPTYNTSGVISISDVNRIGVGADGSGGTDKLNGELADVWSETGRYADLSIAANRRKFFSADNCLVNKGNDGSLPFGVAPTCYFGDDNTASNWHLNNAGTGDMTVNGALADSADDPCGALITAIMDGAYQATVEGLSPDGYWEFSSDATDRAGSLNGTVNGSVTFGVDGPAGIDLGTKNAVDLGGTGDIEVPHDALWQTTYTAVRTIIATEDAQYRSAPAVAGWFYINTALADDDVIVSKDDDETDLSAWGWSLRVMADGSVILRSRTHFHTVEVVAPAGTVSADTWHHAWLRWDRRGVTAAIDGAQLADGYPNSLYWFGWRHRIRDTGQGGGNYTNSAKLRWGKTGSSGRADIRVCQWQAFMATSDAGRQDISDAQTLADSGAVSALDHHIWGASEETVTAAGYSSGDIQTALNARNAAGGGRVILEADTTTYNENVNIPENVELVGAGSGSTKLAGSVTAATLSVGTDISSADPGTDLAAGATSWTLGSGHGCSAGDWLRLESSRIFQERWSDPVISGAGISDPTFPEVEVVRIATVDGNDVTFDHPVYYAHPNAERSGLRRITPRQWVGVRGIELEDSGTPLSISNSNHVRLIDTHVDQTNTAGGIEGAEIQTCLDVDSPEGFHVDNVSAGSGNPYGLVIRYTTRFWVFIGADYFADGWHSLSHGTSAAGGCGLLWIDHVDCTYRVGSNGAASNHIDIHGVGSEIRIIGGQSTGGEGDGGTADFGGTNTAGYRISVEDVDMSDCPRFDLHDGVLEAYFRNLKFNDPSKWFDTAGDNRGIGDSYFQDIGYSGTSTAPADNNATDPAHPNTNGGGVTDYTLDN